MSRTYRDIRKAKRKMAFEKWLKDEITREEYFSGENIDWWWYQREPKWWRKMAKHNKRRAQTRMAISQVYKGNEDVFFPLDKKPWIYYW